MNCLTIYTFFRSSNNNVIKILPLRNESLLMTQIVVRTLEQYQEDQYLSGLSEIFASGISFSYKSLT